MVLVLHLFGREVLSVQLDLPTIPLISDLSSIAMAGPTEAEEVEEYEEEEPESRTPRLGFRQVIDR